MTVYELVEKLNGEIVRGTARVRVGNTYVVLGRLNGDMMEMTAEGRELAEDGKAVEIAAVIADIDAANVAPVGVEPRKRGKSDKSYGYIG